jgi:hypothetical protein
LPGHKTKNLLIARLFVNIVSFRGGGGNKLIALYL